MRVRCKKWLAKLNSLGLDQSTLRLARNLVSLTEKLALLLQNITFLRRCKRHGIIPNFINNSINLPDSFGNSSQLSRHLKNIKRQMLTHSIRNGFRDVHATKVTITRVEALLPPHVRSKIQPIALLARKNAKSDKKRTLIAKFDRLVERQRHQQPCGSRPDTLRTAQPSGERVRVLDNIEVSPTAIEILAKGPK